MPTIAFHKAALFFQKILYRIYWRVKKFKRRRVGGLQFVGPDPFIEQSIEALLWLKSNDGRMYDALVVSIPYTIFPHPRLFEAYIHSDVFTVTDALSAWGTKGIVSVLVHAVYLSEEGGRQVSAYSSAERRQSIFRAARQKTASWLQARQFDTPLVESFEPLAKRRGGRRRM